MIGSRRDVTGIFWIPTAFREQKERELAIVQVKKENGQRGWRRNKQRISRKAVWSALSDFIAKSIKMKVWSFSFNLPARWSLLRGVSGEGWEEDARQQQAEERREGKGRGRP